MFDARRPRWFLEVLLLTLAVSSPGPVDWLVNPPQSESSYYRPIEGVISTVKAFGPSRFGWSLADAQAAWTYSNRRPHFGPLKGNTWVAVIGRRSTNRSLQRFGPDYLSTAMAALDCRGIRGRRGSPSSRESQQEDFMVASNVTTGTTSFPSGSMSAPFTSKTIVSGARSAFGALRSPRAAAATQRSTAKSEGGKGSA